MTKRSIFLALYLLLGIQAFSQSYYYETSWISNSVKYTGFVFFYTDTEALVRIKYFANGTDKVAQYKGTFKEFTKADGTKDYFLDGENPLIIRGPENSSYSPDNFYLEEMSDGTFKAYTVDDNAFAGGDITQHMKPTLYWVNLDPKSVNQGYLDDYMNEDEDIYKALLFDNSGELELPIYTNAITAFANGEIEGEGAWSVVMSDLVANSYEKQKIFHSKQFPSDWIKTHWDLGYTITSVEFDKTKNTFLLVMSKTSRWGIQSWKLSEIFPKDWINEKWNNGYRITSIAYGNGEWVVVMNQNTGYGEQRWKTYNSEIPKEWIEQNWNEGYSITSANYGNGLWAVTMSTESQLGLQSWKTLSEYPLEYIKEKSNDGYDITTIAHGNGKWFVVMSKRSIYGYNTSYSSYSDIPLEWIFKNSRD
ncbi:hypothetical protein D2V93_06075 [Flagellimonas taeanensis]|uniref:DUF7477 domain-containing protein n=1 Tax=Flavobacteriaceae TaxID=49546 RepID=UPI000E68DC48|nr:MULTISPECIES: hypothetical protein [Allomuricauda]MDC6384533.1 hypothetical protein [Muricauda sp. SK9]RIV52209.1 hypothetical protein D2V93_06075 [Allomuricauda taeanensis]